jgi:hypothetical protein
MDWQLIGRLSMFGLVMGIATVFWIPSNIEPFCWLVIFLICGVAIGRSASMPFVTGLLLGLANCFWITAEHIVFFGQYVATHPRETEVMKSMPMPDSPRLMMAVTGPVVGIISGVVIGLLSLLASTLARPKRLASQ